MGIFYRWLPEPIVLRKGGVKGESLKRSGGWRRAWMGVDRGGVEGGDKVSRRVFFFALKEAAFQRGGEQRRSEQTRL